MEGEATGWCEVLSHGSTGTARTSTLHGDLFNASTSPADATEECADTEVNTLKAVSSDLPLCPTLLPTCNKAVFESGQPEQGVPPEEEDLQEVTPVLEITASDDTHLCDKHDTKEEQERALACEADEKKLAALWGACEETGGGIQQERTVGKTPETRRGSSPWVDGLGWYSQLKELEQRAETNKKYEEEVDAVEEKFVASAVMVQASELEGNLPICFSPPLMIVQ
jgi:hypothetical protein